MDNKICTCGNGSNGICTNTSTCTGDFPPDFVRETSSAPQPVGSEYQQEIMINKALPRNLLAGVPVVVTLHKPVESLNPVDIDEMMLVLEYLEEAHRADSKDTVNHDFGNRQYHNGSSCMASHIIQMIENMQKGRYNRIHFAPHLKTDK